MRAPENHNGGLIRAIANRFGNAASTVGGQAVRSRLFRKYVTLFVTVVGLALLTNGAFEIWFSYQEHKDSLIRIQHEQAEEAAGKIEQFITEIERQIGWTTQLLWSDDALEQRRFDALRLLRQVPAITEFAQIDPTGHEQLRVSRLAVDVLGSNADLSKEPEFAEAVAHKVYYSPVFFHVGSEPYMTLALTGTRRETGVSVAQVNLKLIWDVVSKIKVGDHGRAYVVDAEGRLIAHPNINLVLRNIDMSGLAQVRSARAGAADSGAEQVQEGEDLAGHKVLTAYATVASLGWLVLVETPIEEAYAPLYASIQRTGLVLLGALVLAIVAGLFLAGRMVVPIQALRAGTARIGSGDLGQRIAITTGDELETLADQFNDMAGRLQESYADLEKKVKDRTRELSERTVELEEKGLQLEVASTHKTQFLANMSHELRTPLNAILGYTELILDGIYGEAPTKMRVVLDRVQANGKHLLDLINDVLDLSKIEAGQLTLSLTDYSIEDIVQVVSSAVEPLASGKKLDFRIEMPPDLPSARGDGRRLMQVLLNLVGNAIKFTDTGEVAITASAANGSYTIAVRDTGPGIPEADQARIFDEFQQADSSQTKSKGGTGLGLSIAKHIIEMHGGRLWVESSPGNGSTFFFTVPIRVEQQAGPA